ncbi:MAG: hypothetical protein HKO90_08245 [Flavobacteriaceae bacterium]|nr:hypothetical protein [Flavobacteriaceae bacterium]
MKHLAIVTFALILLPLIGNAQNDTSQSSDDITGSWTIDLRPSPKADGYYQTLNILAVDDNTINGTFYDSQIENGFINDNWDQIYFAFTTSDNTHDYYHSGYLKNGRLYGISYCPGRNFTAPWNGVKIIKQ